MRLSVLDQSPVKQGSTGAAAIEDTLDLARHAEALGYARYWLAEHHGGGMLAGPSPEVLIAAIARETERIRVGSAGVMLPHYSPFKVAETFTVLGALAPGRVDLGVGRASGTDPLTAFALQRDRRQAAPDDFPQQLAELLALLDGTLPDGHPFARLAHALPGDPHRPEPWLLGSSAQSAVWAAELGLPYAFADFINPGGAEIARAYRDRFRPSERLERPHVAVAAWALAADTDEEADHLAMSARMTLRMLRSGRPIPVPPPDQAERFLASAQGGGDRRASSGRRSILGAPQRVRAKLEELADEYGADEVVVLTITFDHEARRRSYALLAEAFGLATPAALAGAGVPHGP